MSKKICTCPHCHMVYRSGTSGGETIFGSPLIVCNHCGKPFFDQDIKEPALYGFRETERITQHIFGVIALGLFSLLMFYAAIFHHVILGFIMGIVFLGGSIFMGIDIKKDPNGNVAQKQAKYDESRARLMNTDYLQAIAKFDPKAKNLLAERLNGQEEHYAKRPAEKQ